jgi:hypothetical protein
MKSLKQLTIDHFTEAQMLPPESVIDPKSYKQISKRLLHEQYEGYLESEWEADRQNDHDLLKGTIEEIGGWEKIIKDNYIIPGTTLRRMKRSIEHDIHSRKFNVYLERVQDNNGYDDDDREFLYLRSIRENILEFYDRDSIKNKIIQSNTKYFSSKMSNREIDFSINYDVRSAPNFPLLPLEKGLSSESKKNLFKAVSRTFRQTYQKK